MMAASSLLALVPLFAFSAAAPPPGPAKIVKVEPTSSGVKGDLTVTVENLPSGKDPKLFILYLDRIPLTGVHPRSYAYLPGGGLELVFTLERNEKSKPAWNHLLGRWRADPIRVALGTEEKVDSDIGPLEKQFHLLIIHWTWCFFLIAVLIALAISLITLAHATNLLRDRTVTPLAPGPEAVLQSILAALPEGLELRQNGDAVTPARNAIAAAFRREEMSPDKQEILQTAQQAVVAAVMSGINKVSKKLDRQSVIHAVESALATDPSQQLNADRQALSDAIQRAIPADANELDSQRVRDAIGTALLDAQLTQPRRDELRTLRQRIETAVDQARPLPAREDIIKAIKSALGMDDRAHYTFFKLLRAWWPLVPDLERAAWHPSRPPYSLALTQTAFWFFLAVAGYLYIGMVTWDFQVGIGQSVPILLGISTTTGLAAVMIDADKQRRRMELEAERERVRGTERANEIDRLLTGLPAATGVSKGFLTDVLSDGEGYSLHRFQIFVWTIVLGMVFVGEVLNSIAMPVFDTTLLTLMGISSGTYIGFKFPERPEPKPRT